MCSSQGCPPLPTPLRAWHVQLSGVLPDLINNYNLLHVQGGGYLINNYNLLHVQGGGEYLISNYKFLHVQGEGLVKLYRKTI